MRRNQFVRPRYVRYVQTKQPTLVGHEKSMPTPCKCNQSSQIIVGDPETNFEKGDLINFKDDIVIEPKPRSTKSAKLPKNDKIDFQSDIEWPPGQAPQVKRKLEHPQYKIVTATLVHTDNGAKIVVKGVEDPALLSEDQKDFIREQVKEVLLREIAKSKRWGKIPSVQSTFQLAIGNFFCYLLLLIIVRYFPTNHI